MRELTVYRAAHTQPRRLPRCLAKPAHPACWDKFPGRRHSPQVRRGELEEQPLLRSPGRSNTASRSAQQHLAPLGGSPGASGKPREAELPGGCVPAAPPPSLFPAPGVGGASFRGKAASTGFCLIDARSEDKKNPRGRGGRPRPSPQDRGPKRRWKRDSPEGVSGGEVSLDGQVTPHLLPTPDTQAQLLTRRGGPPACGRPP